MTYDKANNWCSEKLPCARYEAQAGEIERLRDAAMDAHDALVSAKAFIFQKHGTQNPARNEAIDKLRAILGDPARAALGETE